MLILHCLSLGVPICKFILESKGEQQLPQTSTRVLAEEVLWSKIHFKLTTTKTEACRDSQDQDT